MSYTKLLVLALVLCTALRADAGDDSFLRRRRTEESSIVCRISLEETLGGNEAKDSSNILKSEAETLCTPIVNNVQLAIDSRVELPRNMVARHQNEISKGTLIVSISGASLSPSQKLVLGESPHFEVLKDRSLDGHRGRHLMEPFGDKTVSVVRISTQDSEQENSVSEIQQVLFGGETSFVTQFRDCSHGKISWELNKIISVKVPGRNSDYNGDSYQLLDASMLWLQENGHATISEDSDRTIFCFPEGFGDWAARAAMNHWRTSVSQICWSQETQTTRC